MKNCFFISFLLFPAFLNAQTTYTWIGGSTGDYQVAANWQSTALAPRTTPASNDVLQFTSSATVTNVPTQTIGQLLLSNNASVILGTQTGATRVLTVGATPTSITGTDINVPTGCTLTLQGGASGTFQALSLKVNNNSTANIAGTLTIAQNGTVVNPTAANGLTINTNYNTLGAYIYNGVNLYVVTATGTTGATVTQPTFTNGSTTNGATFSYVGTLISGTAPTGTYACMGITFDCNTSGSAVTTVSSGGVVNNYGQMINAGTTPLIFQSGSTINDYRPDGQFPNASYTSVNVNEYGFVTGTPFRFPSSINNLTINATGQTGTFQMTSATLIGSSTTLAIAGDVNITSSGTNGTVLFNLTSVTVGGNMTVSNKFFDFSRTASGNTSNFTITGNLTISNASGSTANVLNQSSSTASGTSTLTVNGFTQSGAGTFNISSSNATGGTGNFDVQGDFTKTNGTFSTSATAGITGNIRFIGTSVTSQKIDVTSNVFTNSPNVVVNNSGGGIALNKALTLNGNLTLTNGIVTTTATNILTLGSASVFTGGSSSFVNGPMIVTTVGTTPYTLFIGSGTIYSPLVFTPSSASATTWQAQFIANTFSAVAITAPVTSTDVTGYFQFFTTTGSGNATLKLPYAFLSGVVNNTSNLIVANFASASWQKNGTAPIVSGSLTSGTVTTDNAVSITTSPQYFCIASTSYSTNLFNYTWTGATSSDYQVGTNWLPNRSGGTSTNDVLYFNINSTVTNVPSQTIGQIILSNNASVSFQSQSGGTRTLTFGSSVTGIAGTASKSGDDLSVPSGCTLTLASTGVSGDNLILKTANSSDVTANIAGRLIIGQNSATTYNNQFDVFYGVTTISGTLDNYGSFPNATSATLKFVSGSTYNDYRTDGVFPNASYTAVNVNEYGFITGTPFNIPSSINNLTINATGQTGAFYITSASLIGSSTTLAIAGDVNITSSGTNGTVFFNLNSVTVGGNMTVSNKFFDFSRTLSGNTSNFTITGNLTISNASGSTANVLNQSSSTASGTSTLTVNGFTQSGAGTFNISSSNATGGTGNFDVQGDFTKTNGTFSTSATAGITGNIRFIGTSVTSQKIDVTGNVFTNSPNVVVNNSGGGIALNKALTLNGNLTLTNGIVTTMATNILTMTNASTAIINTPSANSYINGPLALTFPANATNTSLLFPVGKSGNYRPLTFRYNSVNFTSTVTVEQFEGALTTGTLTPSARALNTRYWNISQLNGTSPNFNVTLNSTDFVQTSGSTLRMIQTNGVTGSSFAVTGSSPNYTNSTALTSSLNSTTSFTLGENNVQTTTTVGSIPPVSYGTNSVTFNATVASANPGAGATVTFSVNGNIVGTALTDASGLASFNYNPSALRAPLITLF